MLTENWKKPCTSEFLKDDKNCTSPGDEKTHECLFFQTAGKK